MQSQFERLSVSNRAQTMKKLSNCSCAVCDYYAYYKQLSKHLVRDASLADCQVNISVCVRKFLAP